MFVSFVLGLTILAIGRCFATCLAGRTLITRDICTTGRNLIYPNSCLV